MIDTSLLKDPIEFKARAFLDAYRGQAVPLIRRQGILSNQSWAHVARKLVAYRSPLPNRSWRTGCTAELWEVAERLALPYHAFAFWFYLLSLDEDSYPWIVPVRERQEIFGSKLGCALDQLQEKKLVLADDKGKRYQRQIYKVFSTPQDRNAWYYWKTKLIPTVIDPQGRRHFVTQGPSIFAREHNLGRNYFVKLLDGTLEEYKGWRLSSYKRLR